MYPSRSGICCSLLASLNHDAAYGRLGKDRTPMGQGRISGLEYERLVIGDASYLVGVAGSGPAVVLLHGYPQTHYCWRRVAPALAASHTVVALDLRGYGETRAPRGGRDGAGYSKREMGADVAAILDSLGIDRAAVVGHDRGGRVAYRMAPGPPDRGRRLGGGHHRP